MSDVASAIIVLIAKYGVPYVIGLLDTLKKPTFTVDDLKALNALIDKPGENYFKPAVEGGP